MDKENTVQRTTAYRRPTILALAVLLVGLLAAAPLPVLRLQQAGRDETPLEVTLVPATFKPGETASRPSSPSIRKRKRGES